MGDKPGSLGQIMANDPYCPATRPGGGWCCILLAGHSERMHLSIDYRVRDHGTPGRPILWPVGQGRPSTTRAAQDRTLVDPTTTTGEAQGRAAMPHQAKRPGYTGIPCEQCHSPNTVRVGVCLRCDDCGSAGECG